VRAGVAPEEQLSDARFQSAIAGARVSTAESQRREQSARVDRLRTLEADAFVRAPFSGTVAARYVDPGSAVAAGAPLVRIVSDGPPTLRFAAPERSRAQLGLGTRVTARLRTAPALTLEAEVERIAPEVDPASRLLIVEARARISAPELESQVLGAMFDVMLLESTDGRR
jgi:multidrug efflux pump subunit AcrA (membrane-fusion protein)